MRLEAGLYMEDEIIELCGDTRFEKCHFFSCEFVGKAHRVEFYGCTFENGGLFNVASNKSEFRECLFVNGPQKIEPSTVFVPEPA